MKWPSNHRECLPGSCWLLLWGFLMAWSSQAYSFGPNVIDVRSDEWCPYNCDPTSERPGFMVEMLKEVFEKSGYKIDYQLMSWNRALSEGRKGTHAVVLGANVGEAEGFIYPAVEQGLMVSCFYSKRESRWRYAGLKSLEKISFGALRDGKFSPEIDRYIEANRGNESRVSFAGGDDPMSIQVKKLLAGRIDAFISDRSVALYALAKDPSQRLIVEAGCIAGGEPTYIVFSAASPKSSEWAEMMTKGTIDMRRSGRLASILARYGLKPWPSVTRRSTPLH